MSSIRTTDCECVNDSQCFKICKFCQIIHSHSLPLHSYCHLPFYFCHQLCRVGRGSCRRAFVVTLRKSVVCRTIYSCEPAGPIADIDIRPIDHFLSRLRSSTNGRPDSVTFLHSIMYRTFGWGGNCVGPISIGLPHGTLHENGSFVCLMRPVSKQSSHYHCYTFN